MQQMASKITDHQISWHTSDWHDSSCHRACSIL
jgi:hypothetical protein